MRKKRDLPFHSMFLLFGLFIVACGSTHLMEVWNLWHANYWLAGIFKGITAIASVLTAILLYRVVPKALALPSPSVLEELNQNLVDRTEALGKTNAELAAANEAFRHSQEQQRSLFDAIPNPVWVFDWETLAIKDVNESAIETYGYSRKEFLTLTIKDLRPSEDIPALMEHIRKSPHGDSSTATWRHRKKDGSLMDVEITTGAVQYDRREARLAVATDITERKRIEESVAESEKRFRGLLEAAPDAIVIVNRDGEIVLVNSQTERTFGYSRTELLGQKMEMLVPDRYRDNHPQHRSGFFTAPRSRSMGVGLELHGLRRDGTEFPVEISLSPLETEDGILVSSAIRDVTERKKAEEKFRALLQAAPDAMVIVDREGEIVLVNSQTETMFGYTRAELLNQKVEMLLPGRFRKEHPGHRGSFFRDPKIRSMGAGLELFALRKDGTEFPVEISLSPIETEDGVLVSSAIRDITERKQMEEALRETDEKLRLLVSGVRDYAILMLDPEGRITTWSEGAERIKGYRAEEIIGQHFSKFYTPEATAEGKPALELRHASEQGRFEEEGWRVRKDGSCFWASVVVTPLRDKSGRLRGFAKVTRDITERKRIEEQLEAKRNDLTRSNLELIAANRELEAFSYSVSHDLRAPLRSIDGFSLALLEDYEEKLDQEGRDNLHRVRAATQRMGVLIDDLLNLSRVSRSEMKLQRVNLSALGRIVGAELAKGQAKRQVEFYVEEGMEAYADPHLMRIVLENLLGNAWKFTSKRESAFIEFGQKVEGEGHVYFVRDDGAGFDPIRAARLFGAFQRFHDKDDFPGTGVGLATVQRIIQRHGGRVWAESAVNKGAAFYFTLRGEEGSDS
ncbi:MAG TPA: PAS domain S-box protein [Candidatus Limnocylindrales bacterium]|nr:PAS domain S-box protein [Candidatus Limnocylindrales bacterium]